MGRGRVLGASRRWVAAREPSLRNSKAAGPRPPQLRPRNPLVIPRDNSHARREDATRITLAESDIGGTRTYEFIIECAGDPTQTGEKPAAWNNDAFDYWERATYVLRVTDKEKAGKLVQSIPDGLQKVVQPGFAQ